MSGAAKRKTVTLMATLVLIDLTSRTGVVIVIGPSIGRPNGHDDLRQLSNAKLPSGRL
jgi:hypothetical protein